jgi:hypothetical protein
MFKVADTNNWFWWNLGGWSNTAHAVEYSINGTKTTGPKVSGTITTGQWYDIKVTIQGGTVNCYLDNVLTQTFTVPSTAPVYSVASMKESTREIIFKSVNTTSGAVTANIVLNGASAIAPTAQKTVLTSSNPANENSFAAPNNVAPADSTISTPSTQFALNLPAYSATILRVQALAVAPQNLSATAGNQQSVLGWSSAAGATSYTVKRATSSGGPYTEIASGLTDTHFTDTGLTNGTTYYYLVTAVNSAGETATATAATATPVLPPISAQELVGAAIVVSGSNVQLTVKSSVPGRVYTLQRCDDLQGNSWQTIGVSQTGTGGDLVFIDAYESSIPKRFYRVQLSAP